MNLPEEPTTTPAAKGKRTLSDHESWVIGLFTSGRTVSKNTNQVIENQLTFGDRVADKVASFGGSWAFVILFFVILISWIALNTILLAKAGDKPFDPYPYILLNLVLSTLAAIQAPIILMSQNRQNERDRIEAGHDYEVNLKSELAILDLHLKLDKLGEEQWEVLIDLQQKQLLLLGELHDASFDQA